MILATATGKGMSHQDMECPGWRLPLSLLFQEQRLLSLLQ